MKIIQILATECPICNQSFQDGYCSSCGLPLNTMHLRRLEHVNFENYQRCIFCDTTNPFGAKYCRSCGHDMQLQAKDKHGHGWVDLGLSVLWSTETMMNYFLWNDSQISLYQWSDMTRYSDSIVDQKDAATIHWGEKWRIPTKTEFEELVKKCQWEKCLLNNNKHVLKVIGPNGKSITIPVTGEAGCNHKDFYGFHEMRKEAAYSDCYFWTSTTDTMRSDRAYAFIFHGYKYFARTLTDKEKKAAEFKSQSLNRMFNHILKNEKEWWHEDFKTEIDQIKLLNAMDDRLERIENEKDDSAKRAMLWLETPIKLHCNEEHERLNTIHPVSKTRGLAIRPVVDKKWQGHI